MTGHLLLEVTYSIIISIGKEMHHPGVFILDVHLEMIHEHAPVSLGQPLSDTDTRHSLSQTYPDLVDTGGREKDYFRKPPLLKNSVADSSNNLKPPLHNGHAMAVLVKDQTCDIFSWHLG